MSVLNDQQAALVAQAIANGNNANVTPPPPIHITPEAIPSPLPGLVQSFWAHAEDVVNQVIQPLAGFSLNDPEPQINNQATKSAQPQYEPIPPANTNAMDPTHPTFSALLAVEPFSRGLQLALRPWQTVSRRWHRSHSARRLMGKRQLILREPQLRATLADEIYRHPSVVGMQRAQNAPLRPTYSPFYVLTTNVPARTDLIFGRKGSITGRWAQRPRYPPHDSETVLSPDSHRVTADTDTAYGFETVLCPDAYGARFDEDEEEAQSVEELDQSYVIRLRELLRQAKHDPCAAMNAVLLWCLRGISALVFSAWFAAAVLFAALEFLITLAYLLWQWRGMVKYYAEDFWRWLRSLGMVLVGLYFHGRSMSRHNIRTITVAVVGVLLALGYAHGL